MKKSYWTLWFLNSRHKQVIYLKRHIVNGFDYYNYKNYQGHLELHHCATFHIPHSSKSTKWVTVLANYMRVKKNAYATKNNTPNITFISEFWLLIKDFWIMTIYKLSTIRRSILNTHDFNQTVGMRYNEYCPLIRLCSDTNCRKKYCVIDTYFHWYAAFATDELKMLN